MSAVIPANTADAIRHLLDSLSASLSLSNHEATTKLLNELGASLKEHNLFDELMKGRNRKILELEDSFLKKHFPQGGRLVFDVDERNCALDAVILDDDDNTIVSMAFEEDYGDSVLNECATNIFEATGKILWHF